MRGQVDHFTLFLNATVYLEVEMRLSDRSGGSERELLTLSEAILGRLH